MKIKNLEEIKEIVEKAKQRGKKIVTTNGCFDILHVGHIKMLKEAKKLGDLLIVGLNSDSSVRKIKGVGRPIINENERAEILAALESVDYIVVFNEKTPVKILSIIKPNIHAKGQDRKLSEIIEKEIVEKNKGKVVLLPLLRGISTTHIIKKVSENPDKYKKECKRRVKNFP